MRYTFGYSEEQQMSLANAVGAYLDAEHYIYLHSSLMNAFEVLATDGRKIRIRQGLHLGWLRTGLEYTMEYEPPGTMRNYGVKPYPRWIPSIHHVLKTRTTVRFVAVPERDTTIMEFSCELEMPFWLWPARHFLGRMIQRMHKVKDDEDVAMIRHRAKVFGLEDNSHYLADHQFMFHKELYNEFFGSSEARARAAIASGAAAGEAHGSRGRNSADRAPLAPGLGRLDSPGTHL